MKLAPSADILAPTASMTAGLSATPYRSKNPLERQTKGEFDLVIALHDDGDRGNGIQVSSEPLV